MRIAMNQPQLPPQRHRHNLFSYCQRGIYIGYVYWRTTETG